MLQRVQLFHSPLKPALFVPVADANHAGHCEASARPKQYPALYRPPKASADITCKERLALTHVASNPVAVLGIRHWSVGDQRISNGPTDGFPKTATEGDERVEDAGKHGIVFGHDGDELGPKSSKACYDGDDSDSQTQPWLNNLRVPGDTLTDTKESVAHCKY